MQRHGGVLLRRFGLARTTKIKRADIEKRVKELEKLTKF